MAEQTFLSDEEIANSWIFWIFYLLNAPLSIFFNSFEFANVEAIPPHGEGALMVGFHTTHNADIFASGSMMYSRTGRVSRGLYHRTLYETTPILKYLGGVAGERDTAKKLISSGHLVAVIPGGGEEAVRGHENAYALRWESSTGRPRLGFAHVALSCGKPVKIIPVFAQNCEEMRWNPIHWFYNFIYVTRLWAAFLVLCQRIGAPKIVLSALFMIGAWLWYITSFVAIPIPVRVTMHAGKPVIADPATDKAEDVAEKVQQEMRRLITTLQPYAPSKCYSHALKERFLPSYQPPASLSPHTDYYGPFGDGVESKKSK